MDPDYKSLDPEETERTQIAQARRALIENELFDRWMHEQAEWLQQLKLETTAKSGLEEPAVRDESDTTIQREPATTHVKTGTSDRAEPPTKLRTPGKPKSPRKPRTPKEPKTPRKPKSLTRGETEPVSLLEVDTGQEISEPTSHHDVTTERRSLQRCSDLYTPYLKAGQVFRLSLLGLSLTDTLDDLINDQRIEPQLAMKVLANFDRVVTEVLAEKVKARLTFKGHLDTYRFCDEVWTFLIKDVTFKLENSNSFQADKIKIVSCNSKRPGEV